MLPVTGVMKLTLHAKYADTNRLKYLHILEYLILISHRVLSILTFIPKQ